jgi:GNAT superfamily N-acetyltransferase
VLLIHAVEADYPEIVELVNLAFRGQGENSSWNVEDIIEGQRINDSLLREDLASKPNAHFLLHRDEQGTLLGTVLLDPGSGSDPGPDPGKDGVWYLGLLTVRPNLQKQHLGRTLLSAAEAFAKERGASTISMTVVNARKRLIEWYERRGYAPTGETRPFPYGDERFGRPLRDDLHFVVLKKEI